MATYAWEARTRTGEVRKGEMDADNETTVVTRLRQQQMSGAKIKKKGGALDFQLKLPSLPSFGTGVTTVDVVIFTRQFATMINAGLPLVQCLEILGTQSPSKRFGQVLMEIKGSVEGGQQLSESMARHPKVFSALYTNLVAAGEAGGILDTILNRLAIYLEKAAKLARQVRGALVYPISVLVVAILVLIVLLWKVIPIFERMFADFGGAKLPVPTQVVIALSNGFIKFAPLIVGGLIGIFVGTTALLRWEPSRRVFDRVLLKVPIFGPVIRKVAVARFTRTLGTLMASGVPILDALGICAKVAGNYTVEDALLYSREKISEGRSIVEPLGETKVFPPMVIQMIGVGEATGAMDTMLGKIADFYEEEVDVAVAALTRLIEPAMFVFLGGVVGGLMVAMYLPVFELAGAIKTE